MTDLLITIIISGIAVTYVIEFIELTTFGMFGVPLLNRVLTLPLSFGALFSQYPLNMDMASVPDDDADVLISRILREIRIIQYKLSELNLPQPEPAPAQEPAPEPATEPASEPATEPASEPDQSTPGV